jgi:hypothetical protein
MENFPEVLNWIVTGGSVVVVSWFVSWLLEDYDWWNKIKSQFKKLLILLLSLAIGIGAQYLNQHPDLYELVLPYLNTAVLVIVAWLATQVAHKADKRSDWLFNLPAIEGEIEEAEVK